MNSPRISVVVVTDRFATIRRVMNHLREHTVAEQIEVVIVAPAISGLRVDDTISGQFASVQVVELDSIDPMGHARAAGIRAASAPVVFLGETHSFPEPAQRYLSGLMVGSHRNQMWSVGRRLLYVCASPLIPVVILSRIAQPVRVLARRGAYELHKLSHVARPVRELDGAVT